MKMIVRLKRYIRGGGNFLRWIFWEKPRGLDFSFRQKSFGIAAKGNHGYALTQEKSFDNIMKQLDINSSDSFIDIGCGKGGCLLYASKYPFKRIAGVEIEESLYKIAKKNFVNLKMPQVELYKADAITFSKYGEFSVFFLFNPFDKDIYEKVIDSVLSTLTSDRKEGRVYIICYGATITDYIKSKGIVEQVSSYTDHVRETGVVIWRWKK